MHIACCSDALSILRLSTTCRKVRSAVYDSLVFRKLLESSQEYRWNRECLKTKSIEATARKDAGIWARFAVADDKAWDLAQRESNLENPDDWNDWLPELFIVKHPFMFQQCWSCTLDGGPTGPFSQVFCLALAVLASDNDMPRLAKTIETQQISIFAQSSMPSTLLWALCSMVLTLRASLRTRQAAWPYNTAANVPHISPPTALQIPFEHGLAMPFTKSQQFGEWYGKHDEHLFSSPDYFSTGKWCGYYTHLGAQARWCDPPMVNIDFCVIPSSQHQPDELSLKAESCHDGIGPFNITGRLARSRMNVTENGHRDVVFTAAKHYTHNNLTWNWDLRVTPFGMLGFWGRIQNDGRAHTDDGSAMHRLGTVWLWKEEWTATS